MRFPSPAIQSSDRNRSRIRSGRRVLGLYTLDVTPFVAIVAEIVAERSSGRLTISDRGVHRNVFWSNGEMVLATSSDPEQSLGKFLFLRGFIEEEAVARFSPENPIDTVSHFHEGAASDLPNKEQRLREWTTWLSTPLFSLSVGNAAFIDEEPLDADKRVLLQSTPVFVLSGVRATTNGLVIRRALGDLHREIALAPESGYRMATIPLTESERQIAASLKEPIRLDEALKRKTSDPTAVARTIIALMTLGVIEVVDTSRKELASTAELERDMALLASIGSNDPRSLRAVAFSRRLPNIDLYEFLDVARASSRAQIIARIEEMRVAYSISTFPAVVHPAIQEIRRKIDEAAIRLPDPHLRQAYDHVLAEAGQDDQRLNMQQRMARRDLAGKNYRKAVELATMFEYHEAIVLLRQTVLYAPDNVDAWHLLGSCQARNPNWIRQATESFRAALTLDPNHVDSLMSLGDLYKAQGLMSRAESCYEDVLMIDPKDPEATSRLKALKAK